MIKKTFQKVGIEGTHLNIIKAIYDKPTTNIILNSEKLKAFLLRSRKKTRMSTLATLFSIVLKVLATAVREEKKMPPKGNKRQSKWKRKSKTVTVCK